MFGEIGGLIRRGGALLSVAALGAGLAFAAAPASAETYKLTAAAGHPPVFLWVKLLSEFYIPEVDKRLAAAGADKIEWTEAYGGTVAKIGGVLEAIEEGVVDIGFVGTIFEAPKMPLQNVSYVCPFGSADIATVSGAIVKLQSEIPAMADSWTRYNQVYLGGAALDSYHLFTNFPVTSVADLAGKKILAPGPSANWVKDTGAVAVAGNLKTYYNDIKTGVADGVLTFTTGAWASKVFEVAPYVTKVNFGAQFAGGLSINKDVWDGFSPETQKIFRDVAAEYDVRFAEAQQAAADALLAKMIEGGAKVSELAAGERMKWAMMIPNVAKEWAATQDAAGLPGTEVLKGFMSTIKASGADVPRDWSAE
ncbi:C4-dicarboxylate TRAP transporter substrate-binding protein [Oceanibacterium hippocampi]|uniref:Bacterial extracellular solute-binding protein, family 7 n=1 Tax=Oceanibacterium hippocampi TaxID=745714 RepID=A0A1Y5U406_9PROT|nr:C4-dicarboxylate TRAP transporter substrate-binding protein [Oceanibacterium hippocampi]SLN76314.1 Bacterial extracellular solute-binding protein, family 7 [Oceanibacterium hippocampi]